MTASPKSVSFFVIGLLLLGSTAPASVCVDEAGRWPYGPPSLLTSHGAHLVFGSGAAVQLADVEPSGTVAVVGELTLPIPPIAGTVLGDLLLLVDRVALHIVDVSDPLEPEELGFLAFDPPIVDVAASGSTAFVIGHETVHVIDVSRPESPRLVASKTFGSDLKIAAAVEDDLLFLLQVNRFRIVDVSIPDQPTVVGTLFTGTAADDVVVSGGYAYIANRSRSITVVDVGNPTRPIPVTNLPGARTLWIGDGLLLAAGAGLLVYDVNDPGAPLLAGSDLVAAPCDAVSLTIADGLVFLADAMLPGLRSFELDAASAPIEAATIELPGEAFAIEVDPSGDRAFVLADGIFELDLTGPDAPVEVGSLDGAYFYAPIDMALSGDLLFVADMGGSISLFDVSTAGEPHKVYGSQVPFDLYPVVVADGPFAYAGDGGSLRIYDATVPEEWHEAGRLDRPWGLWVELAVENDVVYLADDTGLRSIDVADPSAPAEIGFAPHPGPTGGLAVQDGLAYLVVNRRPPNSSELVVFDCTDPTSPLEIGSWNTQGSLTGVAVSGDEVLLTGDGAAVTVIDVSNPFFPRLLGRGGAQLDGRAGYDIEFSPPFALVALGSAGATVFTSAPCAPRRPSGRALPE